MKILSNYMIDCSVEQPTISEPTSNPPETNQNLLRTKVELTKI